MIIVDPVTLGDVACTRASTKWVYDRTGTLVQVPANTLAVTYDPSDLTKAPYALVEPAATNLATYSDALVGPTWGNNLATSSGALDPAGGGAASHWEMTGSTGPYLNVAALVNGQRYTASVYFKGQDGNLRFGLEQPTQTVIIDTAAKIVVPYDGGVGAISKCANGWYRASVTFTAGATGNRTIILYAHAGGASVDLYGFQVEAGDKATSYISATGAPSTRAADVIAGGAGLVYSNVAISEATYSTTTTYAKDAYAYDPATHTVYQSIIAGNLNKALTDTTAWTPRGATNRWAMLDQYNNTQTTNADEILLVLSPQAISQGLYLGNLFADEVRISVVDKAEGLVYSETKSLTESNSGSSFFNWAFKRIKRKDYFLTLELPPYANALVTISLRKVGGTAKCGMCAIGPMDEFGPTLMGLSTEGKDYSSTTFAFDGTSSTVIRPYAKRMTCDVMVDNNQIDYLQARLFEIRQKPVVWVGGPYGSTAVYGRYDSFKNVIQYATRSLMNLTIGGAV